MLSVPSGRFARGTVLTARHSPRLEFLCNASDTQRANAKNDSLGLHLFDFDWCLVFVSLAMFRLSGFRHLPGFHVGRLHLAHHVVTLHVLLAVLSDRWNSN